VELAEAGERLLEDAQSRHCPKITARRLGQSTANTDPKKTLAKLEMQGLLTHGSGAKLKLQPNA
jgi:hypothetical protein